MVKYPLELGVVTVPADVTSEYLNSAL